MLCSFFLVFYDDKRDFHFPIDVSGMISNKFFVTTVGEGISGFGYDDGISKTRKKFALWIGAKDSHFKNFCWSIDIELLRISEFHFCDKFGFKSMFEKNILCFSFSCKWHQKHFIELGSVFFEIDIGMNVPLSVIGSDHEKRLGGYFFGKGFKEFINDFKMSIRFC